MIIFKLKKISAILAIILASSVATASSAYAISFNFTFENNSDDDIILEPMTQREHPKRDPNQVWSTCMGKNWNTPKTPITIRRGQRYTVRNVSVKACKPSVNTWKVSKNSNKDIYGYVQFINHYTLSINNGAFSALIRNFFGVGNTKDPVAARHPAANYASCGPKKLNCNGKNVPMRGGDITIYIGENRRPK
ncbi:hypothetical protein [Brucella anthropi]|uniref:hypothetical protein n=1 Tax=Brucella anthropi TaxID=529 RepID=UPI003986D6CD